MLAAPDGRARLMGTLFPRCGPRLAPPPGIDGRVDRARGGSAP